MFQIKNTMFCALLFAFGFSASASGVRTHLSSEITFHVPSSNLSITGQYDWKQGAIKQWTGPVVLFVNAMVLSNRNGWALQSLQTDAADRKPLFDLAESLVKRGFMVVRFENFGVYPTSKKCYEKTHKRKFNFNTIRQHCVNIEVAQMQTSESFTAGLRILIEKIEADIPLAKGKLILMGFSEGLSRIVNVLDQSSISASAVISIGSLVEPAKNATKWQATLRVIDLISTFDENSDGFISNEEIVKNFLAGKAPFIGQYKGLLNLEEGGWSKEGLRKLKEKLDAEYEEFSLEIKSLQPALRWVRFDSNTKIPSVTNAVFQYHFLDEVDPIDVLSRRNIPSLWIWGELDQQINVEHQIQLLEKCDCSTLLSKEIIKGRHHLLSKKVDLDWFEPGYAVDIVEMITKFIPRTSK
nr:hypothetical protein [uncultured Undibacterium sp.]